VIVLFLYSIYSGEVKYEWCQIDWVVRQILNFILAVGYIFDNNANFPVDKVDIALEELNKLFITNVYTLVF
jgi:hypothetical protein